jgi:hypothetical protein
MGTRERIPEEDQREAADAPQIIAMISNLGVCEFNSKAASWIDILQAMRFCNATNLGDCVFALLAFSEGMDRCELRPDDSLHPREIYIHTERFCIYL